jgi:hypothetical protein
LIRLGARRAAPPRTPEELKGLSDEIRKQKTQLGPPAPMRDGAKS